MTAAAAQPLVCAGLGMCSAWHQGLCNLVDWPLVKLLRTKNNRSISINILSALSLYFFARAIYILYHEHLV